MQLKTEKYHKTINLKTYKPEIKCIKKKKSQRFDIFIILQKNLETQCCLIYKKKKLTLLSNKKPFIFLGGKTKMFFFIKNYTFGVLRLLMSSNLSLKTMFQAKSNG